MEAQALTALSKMVLTPHNLGIMIAAWFLIAMSRKIFPVFYAKSVVIRLLPLFPMLLCMALIWLPGLAPKGATWGWKLVLGILLGWGVGHLHKVLKQTVLGKDVYIEGKKVQAVSPSEETAKVEKGMADR